MPFLPAVKAAHTPQTEEPSHLIFHQLALPSSLHADSVLKGRIPGPLPALKSVVVASKAYGADLALGQPPSLVTLSADVAGDAAIEADGF